MADTKISALPSATTPLTGTEVLPLVQTGGNVKVAVSDLTAGRAVSALSFAGPLNGTVGATTPAAGAFTTLSATGDTSLATTPVLYGSDGAVSSGRLLGRYSYRTATPTTAYFYDFNNSNTITSADSLFATKLATLINSTVTNANALTAYGTSYGTKAAGLSFISGTASDILLASVASPPLLNADINAVVVGYTSDGPRIAIQNYALNDDTANAINYVGAAHRFYPAGSAVATIDSTGLAVTGSLNATASSGTVSLLTQTSATGYGLTIIPGADTVYEAFTINNAANTLNKIRMFGDGSATFAGTLSGGTSGTGYSFSGSAPAGSLSLISGGRFGIGMSLPTSKLTIGNDSFTAAASNTTGMYTGANGLIILSDGLFIATRAGVDRVVLDTSGNLGIGTASPQALLHVGAVAEAPGFGTTSQMCYVNGTSQPEVLIRETTNDVVVSMYADSTSGSIRTATNHPLVFFTNNTERARINAAGGLAVTGTLDSTSTATVNSANSTSVALVVKGETGNGIRQRFIGQAASGQYNWQIGASVTVAGNFEIIPSTAVDGTTFSTPVGKFSTTGLAITGTLSATQGGTQTPTFTSTVNGAIVETILVGKNSTGTARQVNFGINRFADDVWSLSNGTTEYLRGSLTSGGLAVTGTLSSTLDATIYGVTVGRGAGAVSTNTVVGSGALATNSTGTGLTAVGYQTLNVSTADYNTAVGWSAGFRNSSGTKNTFLGVASGYNVTTGQSNTFVGYTSGPNAALSTGSYNTAVGESSLFSNTTASNNTAVGYQAGYTNVTGTENFYGGYLAGNPATGSYLTFVGSRAGNASVTGNSNTAVGYYAYGSGSSGQYNTAIGQQALYLNNTASNNTAVGYQAGYTNTTGASNTAVGMAASFTNISGSNITSIGQGSLYYATGGENTAVGKNAGFNITTGEYNTAVGSSAMQGTTANTGNYNTAIGQQALFSNTTASSNTAVGYQAGYLNQTGTGIVAIGHSAGYTNTAGNNSVYVGNSAGQFTTGSSNTFVGISAGENVTTGAKNTIIGRFNGNQHSLDIRTASNYIVLSDGDGNPRAVFNGSGNLFLGKVDGTFSTSGAVFIAGAGGSSITSDSVASLGLNRLSNDGEILGFYRQSSQVGSVAVTTLVTTYNTTSDYRLKNITGALTGYKERLMSLLPKQGTWMADGSEFRGFVAHEFAEPYRASVTGEKDAVDANGNPKMQSMQASSSEVMADLVAMVKDLIAENDSLKARLDAANL